jgi:uncharacterized protein YqkB
MIMKDLVTAKERLNLVDFAGLECAGCGITSEQLVYEEDWSEDDIDSNSRTTNCGNWYCHIDCFKDSR